MADETAAEETSEESPDDRLRRLMREDPFEMIEPAIAVSKASNLVIAQTMEANRKFAERTYGLDDLLADLTLFWGRAGSVALEVAQWSIGNAKRVDAVFNDVAGERARLVTSTRAVLPRSVDGVKPIHGTWRRVGGGEDEIDLQRITVSLPVTVDRRTEVIVSVDLKGVDTEQVYQGVVVLQEVGGTGDSAANEFTVVVNVPNFPDDREVVTGDEGSDDDESDAPRT
jgi:hypothetical protein